GRRPLRGTPPGDVRLCPLGPLPPPVAPCARSARDQTTLLRSHGARVALRLRNQGHPGGGRSRAHVQRGDPSRVPRGTLRRWRRHLLQRHQVPRPRQNPVVVTRRRTCGASLLASAPDDRPPYPYLPPPG